MPSQEEPQVQEPEALREAPSQVPLLRQGPLPQTPSSQRPVPRPFIYADVYPHFHPQTHSIIARMRDPCSQWNIRCQGFREGIGAEMSRSSLGAQETRPGLSTTGQRCCWPAALLAQGPDSLQVTRYCHCCGHRLMGQPQRGPSTLAGGSLDAGHSSS